MRRSVIQQRRQIRRAIGFAACGFGRLSLQIWILHQKCQQARIHAPLRGHFAPCVVMLPAVRQSLHKRVHQHIARARVKGKHILQPAIARQHGHISDAADVLQRHAFLPAAIEQKFGIGHQRRAQAARGHIAHAEIPHRGAAEMLGQHGGLAQLEGAVLGPAQVDFLLRNVP